MRKCLSIALILACCGDAAAQSAAGRISDEAKAKCQSDYQKLCGGVAPGGGRILKCFQANLDKVTPDYRSELEKLRN